ncbi:MAG: hypothetical protein V3W34_01295 [Phycisphaerae bacterium]
MWRVTDQQNAGFTIWLTKLLHRLAGRPAPYLFCDGSKLFWHATMFPPVVALTLASYWIRWPDRLLRTAVGYVAHCAMTTIAITLNESPYLQPAALLNPLTSTLVNANYLMFGVGIWVLAAGPWYVRPGMAKSGAGPWRVGLMWRRALRSLCCGWLTRVLLLWAGVATIVPIYAMFGSAEAMSARARVGQKMSKVPFFPYPSKARSFVEVRQQLARDQATIEALMEIEKAIGADSRVDVESAPLFYLTAHLLNSLRPPHPGLAQKFRADAEYSYHRARNARAR